MEFEFSDEAKRDLRRLDKSIVRRIITRVTWFGEHFDSVPHLQLQGQWASYFKLRVGDYRVVYEIFEAESIIFIVRIRHRRDVYR